MDDTVDDAAFLRNKEKTGMSLFAMSGVTSFFKSFWETHQPCEPIEGLNRLEETIAEIRDGLTNVNRLKNWPDIDRHCIARWLLSQYRNRVRAMLVIPPDCAGVDTSAYRARRNQMIKCWNVLDDYYCYRRFVEDFPAAAEATRGRVA